jgi:hypothetical protein
MAHFAPPVGPPLFTVDIFMSLFSRVATTFKCYRIL